MANDFSGMFSFQSPEQIRAAAMTGLGVPQGSMAGQGLLQQGVSMMRNAGAGIGMGVAEAMGRQLPEQVKQDKIKSVLQQVARFSDPLVQAQQAYQLFVGQGMMEEAQKAMSEIRKLQDQQLSVREREAKIQKDTAAANKPNPKKEFLQITEFLADLDASVGNGATPSQSDLNKARLYIGKLSKQPRTYTDRETLEITEIPGYDAATSVPNLFKLLNGGKDAPASDTSGKGGSTVIDTSGAKALRAKEIETIQSNISGTKTALENITALQEFRGSGTGWDSLFAWVPNTDAKATAGLVTALKSEQGLGELEKLKSMSPTGASGMGATNAQEVEMLQGRIRKLDPGNKEQFAKDLEFIRNKWEEILKKYELKLQEKMKEDEFKRGTVAPAPAAPAAPAQPAPARQAGATKEGWMQWGRKTYPNKTDAEIEAALRKAGKIQ
jgi:hypothetical protein